MADFSISITGNKELQAALKKISNPEAFCDSVFLEVSNKAIRELVEGSQGKGKIKTGNTARAWRREKTGPSAYVLINDAATLDGKHLIANILNYGHGEIRPVKAKMLYIPLTEKGTNRGTGYKKGLVYGEDFILAHKARKTTGTKFMETASGNASDSLIEKIMEKVRSVFNG